MFDDDLPEGFSEEEREEDGSYWTEEQWEEQLLENERLKDKYIEVFDEDPEREWDDPTDLYLKVHYGIDLGKDFQEKIRDKEEALDEDVSEQEEDLEEDLDEEAVELEEDNLHEEMEQIKAYQMAFQFYLNVHGFVKARDAEQNDDELIQSLCFSAFRTPADIAGGHGLGYEEDTLCGNIVKNKWAHFHVEESLQILNSILERDGESEELKKLICEAKSLRLELEKRIKELRDQVWWS